MQWIKWTLMAAVSCLPALALAEEKPKAPEKQPDNVPKFDLRIEVQTDDGKPKVFHLGNDGKQSEDLAKLLSQFEVKVAQREHEKKPQLDAVAKEQQGKAIRLQELTNQLAKQAMRMANPRQRAHHKGTYLGIATSEPPAVLRKHLGLHDGMGLVIDHVVPESPAAKAGLKEFDVVQKIDDQLVVNYEQFTVLVRDHKPGDEVKLGVIHEGKPAVITAKLIEHEIEVSEARSQESGFTMYRAVVDPQSRWQFFTSQPARALKPGAAVESNRPRVLDLLIKKAIPGATVEPHSAPAKKPDKNSDQK